MQSVLLNAFFSFSFFLNGCFIIFVLFFERREPSRRMGWLLALVFLPLAGAFLYILFSGHFFTKNRRMDRAIKVRNELLAPYLEKQAELLFDEKLPANPVVEQFKPLLMLNLNYGYSLLTFDNNIDIFLWGEEKFRALCADLEAATTSINMAYFIFRKDDIGTIIMDILCRKAEQGVSVRLMYDDFGCITTPAAFFERLNKAGGEARPFFPVRWGFLFSLNFRNHRKIVVIDGKIGYTGGFNVGDEYVNRSRRKKVLWRDTHVRFTGMTVSSIQLVFLIDWYSISYHERILKTTSDISKYFPHTDIHHIPKIILEDIKKMLSNQSGKKRVIPVQIVASGPNDFQRDEIKDAMISMIMSAKKYVYIQTPYFTPDEAFFNALKIASFSGIDVRIMVPDKWDKFYVKAAAFDYIREMISFGITFYHYPGFIHSKTITVDGKIATIGSTNIDSRSFSLHYEMNAFIYDEVFAKKCEDIFLDDQSKCRRSEKDWYDNRFILIRAWWGFCKLLSPLM